MNKLYVTAASTLALASAAASASPTTFFGEDLHGATATATVHPNADNARDDFFSHLINVGTETFEGYSAGATPPLAVNFGTAGTATLTGSGQILTGNNSNAFPISGTKYFATAGAFVITFSAPIAAFGFYGTDLGDFGATLSLSLTASDNTVTTLPIPNATGTAADGSALYFGFYDTANTYKSISFTGAGVGGDQFGFDNFSIGSQEQVSETPVPEPAMLGLFGLGAIGLGLSRRRRG